MREEKPHVQGRCHRAESGKFDVKTEKISVYSGNPGPSAPQASMLPLRHHRGKTFLMIVHCYISTIVKCKTAKLPFNFDR